MKILFIGDIVGRPGRTGVNRLLDSLIKEHDVKFVIANGENAAGGNGITAEIAREFFSAGIHVITLGNHAWDKKEIMSYIEGEARLLRPANYPVGAPGKGYGIYQAGSRKIGVINLCGRVFMPPLDCPFKTFQGILQTLKEKCDVIFVDFHAEATSEKKAFGWYVDGKISAIVGTHTHIQTADERILPKGTAYITDVGMTGPKNSVLGVKSELVVQKFLSQLPVKFEVATGDIEFSAVLIEVDDAGKAKSILRIQRTIEQGA